MIQMSRPAEKDLAIFFHVSPEFDSDDNLDQKEFFSNIHFVVSRGPTRLTFSYSESFGDVQLLLQMNGETLLSIGILSPIDVVLSKDNSKLLVFLSTKNYIEVSVDPGIVVKVVGEGESRS